MLSSLFRMVVPVSRNASSADPGAISGLYKSITTAVHHVDRGSSLQCFGGWNREYKHASQELGCEMKFTVYHPPASGPVPVRHLLLHAPHIQFQC